MSLLDNVTLLDVIHKAELIDDNYLPNGTIIYVNADGSGDFATLNEACDYVNTKCCPGTVTIQLSEGTFNLSDTIVFNKNCTISQLYLKGAGSNKTTINANNFNAINLTSTCTIKVCTLAINNLTPNSFTGIYAADGQKMFIADVKISNFQFGVLTEISNIIVPGNLLIDNCNTGIHLNGGTFKSLYQTITLSNCNAYGIQSQNGGICTICNGGINSSNVKTLSNISKGSWSSNGYLTY